MTNIHGLKKGAKAMTRGLYHIKGDNSPELCRRLRAAKQKCLSKIKLLKEKRSEEKRKWRKKKKRKKNDPKKN